MSLLYRAEARGVAPPSTRSYNPGVAPGGEMGSTKVRKRELRAGGPVHPVTRAGLLNCRQ
jgi:hypothetical protein